MSSGFVIDTPEGIEHYRICALISGLRLEVRTGMKMTHQSMLKLAQTIYGCEKRTKKGALKELEEIYFLWYGIEYGVRASNESSV